MLSEKAAQTESTLEDKDVLGKNGLDLEDHNSKNLDSERHHERNP